MPKCPKCEKEVYFAERVTSLGKDWHRPCLKCEKCNKTLSAGSHAEVNPKQSHMRTQSNIPTRINDVCMMESPIVTTHATLHSLDPKVLGVVALKATHSNRPIHRSAHFLNCLQ
ncbi:hypothetical protein DNTS_028534 [Danionella cerebrum]|uniref:Cysteine-rich protein 1 n=1 Tax=Danionella cerebrum TaxID=2873325 RepID=A0A553MSP1_9TELE|nr:hypothetical protein DNTS_028534 [Danionella translucida]